jgi:hypothetical protein
MGAIFPEAVSMRNAELQSIPTTKYGFAGLYIRSELPLPGVTSWPDDIAAGEKILIRRAKIPRSLSNVTAVFAEGQCNDEELLLNIEGVSRYLMRGGNEICVDQTAGSTPGEVCAYLLGTAFGVLCHQRGILPLHASGVDVTDGCVVFIGKSGAGKSTLVAAMAARGHRVISDDVCFLQRGEREHIRVWPGLNRLRLWEDAMKALRCGGSEVEREFRRFNKYHIPLPPLPNPNESRRLRRIYQLHAAPEGDRAVINRLQGATALEVLMQNVYRSSLAEHMGHKRALFVACAAAARDIPIFQFSRPLCFHALSESVDLLEDHLSDLQ